MGATLILALLLTGQSYRPTLRDLTFLPIFEKANPEVRHFAELKRLKVAGGQDLVVMLASPQRIEISSGIGVWWPKGALVGVFLQDYWDRSKTTALALLSEPVGFVNVERARDNELVLTRTSADGEPFERLKLFFDVQLRKLLSKTTYRPFPLRILGEATNTSFIASTGSKALVFRANAEVTGFELVSEQEVGSASQPERMPLVFGPERQYRLIERPHDSWGPQGIIVEQTPRGQVAHPLPRSAAATGVGPHQIWNHKLWFGLVLRDAEGPPGVGGFGFFDGEQGSYFLYSPPELRDWSVSALLVESDAVWLGLVRRGADGSPSGGLVHWNRATEKVTRYRLRSAARAIHHSENALYVATRDGIAVLRSGRKFLEDYIVDVTASGAYRVVPAF